MITVNHLSKIYHTSDGRQVKALDDMSFHIGRGEVVGIIGPSGSGKSTLLRALNLMEKPSSGSILVDGEDIQAPDYASARLHQRMGMVFQEFNLFGHLSVLDNVCLAPQLVRRVDRRQAEAEALAMLDKVAMADHAHAMPNQLSGGQKQRVAIARCLAMKPDIILFDEPTSALDPTMVGEVQAVIRTLVREQMTMLIVSHKMKFIRDISSRVFFVNNGRLEEDGPTDQVFNHPRQAATRAFVESIRSLTFDIATRSFDFHNMMSQIRQFCIHYAIPEKMNTVTHIVEEMLLLLSNYDSPVHIEVNHSELRGDTQVIIVHKGESVSPLERPDADELAVMIIQGMSKGIDTEQVPEGVRVTFKV